MGIYCNVLLILRSHNIKGDIEITYSGLRPGEKLYEELLIGDNVSGTQHQRIMQANEAHIEQVTLQKYLDSLQHAMNSSKTKDIKKELIRFVDGYTPWVSFDDNHQGKHKRM